MSEVTYPFALPVAKSPEEILDRMAYLVGEDRLVHGVYVDDDPRHTRTTSLCGGHKFCAVGTEFFAAGVPLQNDHKMLGVVSSLRDETAAVTPHLAEVRDALNEVARRYIASGDFGTPEFSHGIPMDSRDALETLFECCEGVTGDVLLEVINEARSLVAPREAVFA